VQAGDCYLICSDGLSNYVEAEELARLLTSRFYRDVPRRSWSWPTIAAATTASPSSRARRQRRRESGHGPSKNGEGRR
jgi:serine/threonine protein phosphatase PrpC